jgi:hypothetical protein
MIRVDQERPQRKAGRRFNQAIRHAKDVDSNTIGESAPSSTTTISEGDAKQSAAKLYGLQSFRF